MGARQDADAACERSNLCACAAIRALTAEDAGADGVRHYVFKDVFDLRGIVLFGEVLARLFKEGLRCLVPLMPAEAGGGFEQSFADEGLNGVTEFGVFLGGLDDGLGLAGEAFGVLPAYR